MKPQYAGLIIMYMCMCVCVVSEDYSSNYYPSMKKMHLRHFCILSLMIVTSVSYTRTHRQNHGDSQDQGYTQKTALVKLLVLPVIMEKAFCLQNQR